MKIKQLLTKTLLVAVGLLAGQSVWAVDVASYDFEDSTYPFTGKARQTLSVVNNPTLSSKVFSFATNSDSYNQYALAEYSFKSAVSDAATVTIEFDLNLSNTAGNHWVSIGDAELRAETNNHGGFGNRSLGTDGIIMRIGTARMAVSGSTETVVAINNSVIASSKTTKTASQIFGTWIHVKVDVDHVGKKVSYIVKQGEETIATASNVAFYKSEAARCSQIDFSSITNSITPVLMDNLVITKTVSDVSHTYSVIAVSGETTLATIATSTATEGASYGAYVPYVVSHNGKFYVLDDTSLSNYYVHAYMGASDAVKQINYTLDGKIVAYTEGVGSNYRHVVGSNNPAYSGGDYINNNGAGNPFNARNRGFSLGTLPAGAYQMVAYVVNSGSARTVAIRNSDSPETPIVSIVNTDKVTKELTANFTLSESTPLIVNGANSTDANKTLQCEEFDYVLVRLDLSEETAAFNALKTHADALVAVDNDNSAANSTLAEAITTQANAVAEATTAGAITNATTALKNAMYNYVAAANPTTGNRFDLTYLLTDPAGETFTAWGAAGEFGWFTDIPTTGMGDYNNFLTRITSEDKWTQSKNGVERYTSNACTEAGTYALYQKVTLPAGNYSFNADALANNTSAIVMAAGSTEGDAVTAGDLTAYSVDFTQPSESEIKVGLKISSYGTNAANWMAIADLKLYKEAASYVSVTIASSGYSSLGSAYGLDFANATTSTNGAAALTAFAATESSEISVKLVSIDEAPAATGVILKGTPGATYTIPVKANAAALTVTNLLHAAVTATNIVGNTSYIMQGGEFHLVTEASTVPAGKAYLQAAPGSAKALTVVFVDDLTGVANVNAAEAVQPVKRIVNGQLVIEKNGKRFNAAGAEF